MLVDDGVEGEVDVYIVVFCYYYIFRRVFSRICDNFFVKEFMFFGRVYNKFYIEIYFVFGIIGKCDNGA